MEFQTYNRSNFHKNTFCVFNEVSEAAIANLKPNYKSKSGSSYYFTENGVYRLSNHWGRAANCKWRLQTDTVSPSRTKLGFANWSAFHRDNDSEKLYYIEMDLESKNVTFQHKDNGNYKSEYVLRTASETTKIIKQIRHLLTTDAWAKHFEESDIEILRKTIIVALATTKKSLHQIKSEL